MRPLVDQVNIFVNEFPGYVNDAQAGRGTIGQLVKRYDIDGYVQRNQQSLRKALTQVEKPAVHLARSVLDTLTAAVTIIVVTFLLLIEGPRMMRSGLGALSPPVRAGARQILDDASRTLAGYVVGGLLATSALAGARATCCSGRSECRSAGVLALWTGFAAVIPLVGALIGAVPAVTVAFIHSTPAGIAVLVLLIVYHLVENRTLGKWINRQTVGLSAAGRVLERAGRAVPARHPRRPARHPDRRCAARDHAGPAGLSPPRCPRDGGRARKGAADHGQ